MNHSAKVPRDPLEGDISLGASHTLAQCRFTWPPVDHRWTETLDPVDISMAEIIFASNQRL